MGFEQTAPLWPADATATAARVPIWTRPPEVQGFTPWSSYSVRFPEDGAADPAPAPAHDIPDAGALRDQAYAEGFEEGRRSIAAELAGEREALATLAAALEALQPEQPRQLGLLLAETVKRLVHQIVGEVTLDEQTLLDRALAAAELIADDAGPAKMRVHPADHERLSGAHLPVELVADPHLAPGTILLETGEGWIEDGPDARLEKLRAALDKLGGPR